jgi:hypothetical protein
LRAALLRFIRNVLDAERFDPLEVERYLE